MEIMETTPKLNKRSLSLQNCRIKRNSYVSTSPQNNNHTKKKFSNMDKLPCSPILPTRSCPSECFTPTHKRINLDDTLDSSQKALDTSFSPNSLFSQSLPTESPEVGWRWARQKSNFTESGGADESGDSPCALDNSKSSKKRKIISYRREQHRKAIEFDIHRAEKSRAKQVLQKRYAKLKEQLKEAKLPKILDVDSSSEIAPKTSPDMTCFFDSSVEIPTEMLVDMPTDTLKESAAITLKNDDMSTKVVNSSLNDFFNDSDSDGFLLEATQQIESKIHLTVPDTASVAGGVTSNCTEIRDSESETNNTSTSNEKRSLYEKFLEDDSPDDWFTSLDDVIEQAIQAKKPRNSLQRYKSMPTEVSSLTISHNTSKNVKSTKICPTIVQASNPAISRQTGNKSITTTTDISKLKRHASSNTIPSSSR